MMQLRVAALSITHLDLPQELQSSVCHLGSVLLGCDIGVARLAVKEGEGPK